jgi:hypothetical protein
MKKVNKHKASEYIIRPAHDPEWDAIFNQQFDEVPEDLFTQSNKQEVRR